MATIVTRSGKGSPLTHAEVDANFTNLNTDKLELSGGTMTGNLSFGDNDKAIFGAGSDLQIYHAGSYSMIEDTGSGNLIFRTDGTSIFLQGGTETMAVFTKDGSSDLYYDNAEKLTTTSTGVDITGTLTSDGLTVDGNSFVTTRTIGGATVNINTRFRPDNEGGLEIGSADGGVDAYLHSLASGGSITLSNRTGGADYRRLNISSGGDISFYEDTGTTAKFFWDASAESLGIGTSSPSQKLEISHVADSRGGIKVTTSNNTGSSEQGGFLALGGNNTGIFAGTNGASYTTGGIGTANEATIYSVGNVGLAFGTNTTERMRIDSSGNVGIGTVPDTDWYSAVTALQIDDAGSISQNGAPNGRLAIALNAKQTGSSYLTGWEYQTTDEATQYLQIDGSHIWKNAASGTADTAITWSESMRIDSSGNLLVGKTSADFGATAGAETRPDGRIAAGRAGETLVLNRLTSDGPIALFRKDGTTVGSIFSSGGIQMGIGDDNTALLFADNIDAILPWDASTNSQRDNAIDLGRTATRFKDLYLSGGVYLGGTGSANKLDDYEEGTFTTTLSPSSGTITLSSTADLMSYTKIGNRVWVTGRVIVTSVSSPTGSEFYLNSLPFVIKGSNENETGSAGSVTYYDDSVSTYLTTQISNVDGGTAGAMYKWRMFKDCSTIAANDQISFSFTYITN